MAVNPVKRPKIIDGDGHIYEDVEAIRTYIPEHLRGDLGQPELGLFPHVGHLHLYLGKRDRGAFRSRGPEHWMRFLDAMGLEAAVLYPSLALTIGRYTDVDMAVVVARAYNDWLSDTYLRQDQRFKAMGLLALQDPAEAVVELRRIVTDLGFAGGILPTTGLNTHLGDRAFWPVYAEADRLGCCLTTHGAPAYGLGLDNFNVYAGVRALSHPYGACNAFTSLLLNGVIDRCPNARFGFMEAGLGWFLMAMERLPGSYAEKPPSDPRNHFLRLSPGESLADRVLAYINAGRLTVGIKGDEPTLGWAVKRFGSGAFVYATDYPHSVEVQDYEKEVQEILTHEGLGVDDKESILFKNAARLYRI
jgi:predicted TIM-barrel fold metal-dependent hydrolase